MRNLARYSVALCLMFLVGALHLEAQGTAKPFTNRKMESAEEYARIIGSNDSTVLYIHADEIAAAAEEAVGFKLSGYTAMSEWLLQLEQKPCPAGEAQLARILTKPEKRVDVNGWRRPFHEGERCLWADNQPVVSLSCGNFVTEVFPPGVEDLRPEMLSIPNPDSTRLALADSARADWGDILLRLASTRDTILVENHIYLPESRPGWFSQHKTEVGAVGGILFLGGIYCAIKCRGEINVKTVVRVGGS